MKTHILTYKTLSNAWFNYSRLLSDKVDDEPGLAESFVYLCRGTSSTKLQEKLTKHAETIHALFNEGDFIRLALLLSKMSKIYYGNLAEASEKFAYFLLSPLGVSVKQKQYILPHPKYSLHLIIRLLMMLKLF